VQLEQPQDTAAMAKCQNLRMADEKFQQEYQNCLLAEKTGLDTSRVNLSRMDPEQGFDLEKAADGVYLVELSGAKVDWQAKKATGQHSGTVAMKFGEISIKDGLPVSGKVVLDMQTISVSDLQGEDKKKLEDHLRSEDFFSVVKNPEAVFTLQSAVMMNKHQFESKGTLAMRGKTADQKSVLTIVPSGSDMINVSGAIAIDRTTYDIKFRSAKFFSDLGDKLIDDTFFVTFTLKAKVQ